MLDNLVDAIEHNPYVIAFGKFAAFWFAMEAITLVVLIVLTVKIPEFRKGTVYRCVRKEGLGFLFMATFVAITAWPVVYYALYCAWHDKAPVWGVPKAIVIKATSRERRE